MEREVFNYMKFDGAKMPFNEDVEFEASLVENCNYIIPQVCLLLIEYCKKTSFDYQFDWHDAIKSVIWRCTYIVQCTVSQIW